MDLDLGHQNVPPGERLSIADVIIEITPAPHTYCKKFADRFGEDAMRFVNDRRWRKMNLRGLNAKVVQGGHVSVGDGVRRVIVARQA